MSRERAQKEIAFLIPGKPIPQGRPRLGRGHVYYPKTSTAYRQLLVKEFKAKAKEEKWKTPKGTVGVSIYPYNMNPAADGDNLIKQVMDALVEAKIIKGDTVKDVPFILFSSAEDPGKDPYMRVFVYGMIQ